MKWIEKHTREKHGKICVTLSRITPGKASHIAISSQCKEYVQHIFDAGTRLALTRVPEDEQKMVCEAVLTLWSRVSTFMETSRVPPSKTVYADLSQKVVNLKKAKLILEQTLSDLVKNNRNQERELKKMEGMKIRFQGLSNVSKNCFLPNTADNELHLNYCESDVDAAKFADSD